MSNKINNEKKRVVKFGFDSEEEKKERIEFVRNYFKNFWNEKKEEEQ